MDNITTSLKALNLSLVQSRVCNPFGTAVVEYIVLKDERDVAYIIRAEDRKEWEGGGFEAVAQVNVTRPIIMSGTKAEVDGDIEMIIEREIVEAGICETNDAGTLFVK